MPSAWALNSRQGAAAERRACARENARARKKPSGARGKVFWGAFFSKKVRPCPYRRATHEKKLGKQGLCPAFPGRRSARKVASQKLGREPAVCPLRPPLEGTLACRLGQALNGAHWAPAPPKGGGETWLSLRGRYVPVGRCPAADRGGSRDAGAVRRLRGRGATVREKRFAVSLAFSHALRAIRSRP